MWDVLLAELPADVELELDVYWASVGGRDPVTEIRANADRVRLLHMKDRRGGSEPHDAPAGQGTLAFPEIVEAGRAAGVDWYIAEQDDPHDAAGRHRDGGALPRVARELTSALRGSSRSSRSCCSPPRRTRPPTDPAT